MAVNSSGSGVVIFAGPNTYSGGTTISAGTLLANSATNSS
ncbi:autotransporter-associated beta strand repeat-containing protein [Hyphomicrobium sp.]